MDSYTRWYISKWELKGNHRKTKGSWAVQQMRETSPLTPTEILNGDQDRCRSIGKDYNGYAVCKVFGLDRHHAAFSKADDTYPFGGTDMSSLSSELDADCKLVLEQKITIKPADKIEQVINNYIKANGDSLNTVAGVWWNI